MRLYIIRHADPDYANDTITAQGHREAQALADRMTAVPLHYLYTSPRGRAQATAQYTAAARNMTVTTLDWTAELDWMIEQPPGSGTAFTLWDIHGHYVRSFNPPPQQQNWSRYPYFDDPKFHAEFEALKTESDRLLARHGYVRSGGVYRIENRNEDAIAVFCHGGFGLTWLAHLLEVPLPFMYASFFLPPTSVTTILFDERCSEVATPRCIGLGDVAHLHRHRLIDIHTSPSGIKANYH